MNISKIHILLGAGQVRSQSKRRSQKASKSLKVLREYIACTETKLTIKIIKNLH